MPDRYEEFSRLVDQVAELVDEVKLLNLNLTIANARLRLSDGAFRGVGSSFQELLDAAATGSEEAEIVLKRARGDKLSDEEKQYSFDDLDSFLDKVKSQAEHIIRTVMAIKKGQQIRH